MTYGTLNSQKLAGHKIIFVCTKVYNCMNVMYYVYELCKAAMPLFVSYNGISKSNSMHDALVNGIFLRKER